MWHDHSGMQPCIEALARDITARLRAGLGAAGSCTLAVSGGRSPIPLFQRLAMADLDWRRIRLRLVDERYVPPGHPDSNEGLVRRHLLAGKAAAADFRGLYRAEASIGQAVAAANREAGPVDLAVLGMGDDGHTASLFPGAPQLDAALAPGAAHYLHVTPPHAPHERITMSLAGLRACGHLILYISGQDKRDVLLEAEKKISKQLPISHLAAEPGVSFDVHWHP
ncbi:6-phosphogluconolactonase [Alcaligenaceae bacterium]|nr:6-phosphogluconolactonase [Alcaligenaceae bacterium]